MTLKFVKEFIIGSKYWKYCTEHEFGNNFDESEQKCGMRAKCELGLPSFRRLFNDCVQKFNQRLLTSVNVAVGHFIASCTFIF